MAVRAIKNESKINDVSYPKLMKSVNDGAIVYFVAKSKGVCIFGIDDQLGFSDSWRDECFEDYNDPITLQNEV